MQDQKSSSWSPRPTGGWSQRRIAEALAFTAALAVTVVSAVAAKEMRVTTPLVQTDRPRAVETTEQVLPVVSAMAESDSTVTFEDASPSEAAELGPDPLTTRWYNGRKIRPARTMWMTTTAYSPDHRSCGKWADGITASNKSVWTNGMKLVAADTRLLPFGSLVSVPGYDEGRVVPVLDRGGAIKGNRLDLLYPTHAIARKWGVKRQLVTVWEYAD